MKLFVCLHNQLGAISRLRYLSESASHLLSLLVRESIFQLPLPLRSLFIYKFIYLSSDIFAREDPVPKEQQLGPQGLLDQDLGPKRNSGVLWLLLTPTGREEGVGWAVGGSDPKLLGSLSPRKLFLLTLPVDTSTTCARDRGRWRLGIKPQVFSGAWGRRFGLERCFHKASPGAPWPIFPPGP